jgi:glucosamine--fructose-6-phosphate aminotransferase (isomerizing)
VEKAKERGAVVVCVVNVNCSSLAVLAHHKIGTCSGPEIGVASTKSYVGQAAVLAMLAVRLAVLRNHASE